MSKEIDNQVVQMTFDNKQFEKNAAQTISTIDKLKMSLQFKGVSDGLKEISKAIASFPIKSIGNAADTVTNKFSAMGTAVDQLIRNTERRLESFTRNAVNTLNIFKGGLTAGFSEYETQVNAVQTIWANTKDAGKDLDDITRVLDELNEYADKTIYNFTQMTRNIGTFTAAGVGLEESATAIQGIANLAAMSGSTSQQASNAMYQLSQALAAGKVTLMDWNSVVNAGMGGKTFQKVLIETGKELGTISGELAKGLENGTITFRNTLTEYGWITSDVLTSALAKFTDTSTELGRTATDAATKVKTFTQLIETLKETVQSGWTQSWEYIIGDFESARDLFTQLSNSITSLVQPSINARNKMLAYWSGANQANEEAEKNLKAQEKHQNEIEELAKRVMAGEFGNVDTGRYEALDALGYDHREVQNAVDRMLGLAETFDIEAEAAENAGNKTKNSFDQMSGRDYVIKGLTNIGDSLIRIFNTIVGGYRSVIKPLSGEQLTDISKKFFELTESLKPSTKQIKALKSAVALVTRVFKLAGKTIKSFANGVSLAINELLGGNGEWLLDWIIKLEEEFWRFELDLNKHDLWSGITEATKRFVKYIAKAIMGAKEYISGLFEMKPSDAVAKVIEDFTNSIKELFETTGDGEDKITGLQQVLNMIKYVCDETNKVLRASIPNVEAITNALGKFWEVIKGDELLDAWNPIDFFIALGNSLKHIVEDLTIEDIGGLGLTLLIGEISKFIKSLSAFVKSITNPVTSISNPLFKAINDLKAIASSLPALIITFTASVAALLGMVYLLTTADPDKAKGAVVMMTVIMAELIIAMKLLKKMQEIDPDTPEASLLPMIFAMSSLVSSINKLAIMMAILGKLNGNGEMWDGFAIMSSLVALVIVLMYSMAGMSRYMTGAVAASKAFLLFSVALNSMLLPMAVLSYISEEGNGFNPNGAIDIILSLSVIAGTFMGLLSNLTNSADLVTSASSFVIFAIALTAMTAPLSILVGMAKINNTMLLRAEGLILTFTGLFGVFAAMSAITSAGDMIATSASFVIFAGALVVMAKAMQMLAEIPGEKLGNVVDEFGYIVLAIGSLIGIILVLTGALQAFGIGWVAPLVIAALALMVGSFALLGFAISDVLDSMSNFSDAMIRFANADFKNFGKNLKTIIQSIKMNLADMGDVFGQAILEIANAFRENAVPVSQAVGVLLAAVIEMINALIVEMTPATVELVNGLLNLLLEIVVVAIVDITYWLVKAFFAGITAALKAADEELPALIDALNSFLNSLGDSLIANGEQIHEGCAKIMKGISLCLFGKDFESGYSSAFGIFMAAVLQSSFAPGGLIATVAAGCGIDLATWLSDGLSSTESQEQVNRAAVAAGEKTTSALVSEIKKANDGVDAEGVIAGDRYISSLVDELNWRAVDVYGEAQPLGEEMVNGTIDGIGPKLPELKAEGERVGNNLTEGVGVGIDNGYYANVLPSINNMTNNMINQTNKNLDIHSPSRKFKSIGEMIGSGLSVGIDNSSVEATSSSTSMAQAVIDSVTGLFEGTDMGKSLTGMFSSAGSISDLTSGSGLLNGLKDKFSMDGLFDKMGLDTTITPIMDLSNVSSGISDINSMFGSQSLQLSDLNSSFSGNIDVGQIQNGSYDDAKIVASIANLNARMDALASAISSMQIRMDTGALVGSIAGPMDSALGKRAVYAGRGIR